MIRNENEKITLLEIYSASFLELKGIPAELELRNGKVLFCFPRNDEVYQLLNQYNSNEAAPIADFVSALKNLKARMFVKKGPR